MNRVINNNCHWPQVGKFMKWWVNKINPQAKSQFGQKIQPVRARTQEPFVIPQPIKKRMEEDVNYFCDRFETRVERVGKKKKAPTSITTNGDGNKTDCT